MKTSASIFCLDLVECSIATKGDEGRFLRLALGPDGHTMMIHDAMFLPTLYTQCSDEQRDAWLPAATNYAILGCYGQTEMCCQNFFNDNDFYV
eukprot:m.842538 g.842538  ORF g.842538 m.842538 type:complete len:93 (+) comp23470_c1_seq68:82-360(+)